MADPTTLTAGNIRQLGIQHQGDWRMRQQKIEDWYRVLLLDDSDLYQEDMETVISNDPKTFFKRAIRLLVKGVTHTIPTDVLRQPESVGVSSIVSFLEAQWSKKNRNRRRGGKLPWMEEFISLLLATGWYDILVYANQLDGLVAEIHNPVEGFPRYGGEYGLQSYFHIYTVSASEANRKCLRNRWHLDREFTRGVVSIYDYWLLHDDGFVYNGIVMNNQLVKPMQKMPFSEIPILVGPVGGMPDRGSMIPGSSETELDWHGHVGESVVADNEEVYKNLNKNLSFVQQMVRDTAQSRWVEKSTGDTQILSPDTIYKRGTIFRMGIEEDVGTLPVPALPVELSLHTRSLEDMIQRGSFPWSMYGSLTQEITSYMMAQISAAAQEILSPYVDAAIDVLSEIDNIWIQTMQSRNLIIDGYKIPPEFPEFLDAKVEVAVDVPGDFIQRATLSRMLSPNFRFSKETTMKMLWKEVKDIDREQAKVRADDALSHPVAHAINLITAYRYQAALLRQAGNPRSAQLYEIAASAVERTLEPTATQGLVQSNPRQSTPRQEISPREVTAEGEVMV